MYMLQQTYELPGWRILCSRGAKYPKVRVNYEQISQSELGGFELRKKTTEDLHSTLEVKRYKKTAHGGDVCGAWVNVWGGNQ